jgi:hypothetical protein
MYAQAILKWKRQSGAIIHSCRSKDISQNQQISVSRHLYSIWCTEVLFNQLPNRAEV